MAEDTSDRVEWLLETRRKDMGALGGLRRWPHLRMATEGDAVWIKGFSVEEIRDVVVKGIPAKKVWYSKGVLLFPEGSIVPSRKTPALLWVPIERGLPVSLPPMNHNYFGINRGISIKLVRSEVEREATAMLVSLGALRNYITDAPAIRLKGLAWVMLDGSQALIVGKPLLPIQGESFWSTGTFLIPAGYDFSWPELRTELSTKMSSKGDETILWYTNGNYLRIAQTAFRQLSIGSFRQSTAIIFNSADGTA